MCQSGCNNEPALCSTNPPTESQLTTEQPEQVAGGCPSIAQGQTIEMWSPLTGPDGDEMSALAKRFSDENPWKVTVKHVAQPEYIQKLNAAAAAKQLPAMTVVRAINIGELVERNVLKPISPDLLAVLGEDIASDFPALAWNAGEYEGQRYTIPLDIHPLVMYYNKDMFQKAGCPSPERSPGRRMNLSRPLRNWQPPVYNPSLLVRHSKVRLSSSLSSVSLVAVWSTKMALRSPIL